MSVGKILVTGGAGYIGSHTVVELLSQNYQVVVADNLSNSDESMLKGIEKITGKTFDFMRLDLRDAQATAAIFDAHRDISGVIHFAALKAVGESVEQPMQYYENNLYTTLNLTKAMSTRGIGKLVFSSSCTVYGQPKELPVTEDTPLAEPQSPYGHTKRICEDMLRSLSKTLDIKTIALRYFNPIGAHPSALIGELPLGPPLNLVPVITQSLAGLRPTLNVWGNDYDTPDGSCIRDYIHVSDVAASHVAALRVLEEEQQLQDFDVYNIGTGTGYSVLEVIAAFEQATGVKVPYEIAERRSGDVAAVYADCHKAELGLGWSAKYALVEALTDAWRWQQSL